MESISSFCQNFTPSALKGSLSVSTSRTIPTTALDKNTVELARTNGLLSSNDRISCYVRGEHYLSATEKNDSIRNKTCLQIISIINAQCDIIFGMISGNHPVNIELSLENTKHTFDKYNARVAILKENPNEEYNPTGLLLKEVMGATGDLSVEQVIREFNVELALLQSHINTLEQVRALSRRADFRDIELGQDDQYNITVTKKNYMLSDRTVKGLAIATTAAITTTAAFSIARLLGN